MLALEKGDVEKKRGKTMAETMPNRMITMISSIRVKPAICLLGLMHWVICNNLLLRTVMRQGTDSMDVGLLS